MNQYSTVTSSECKQQLHIIHDQSNISMSPNQDIYETDSGENAHATIVIQPKTNEQNQGEMGPLDLSHKVTVLDSNEQSSNQ